MAFQNIGTWSTIPIHWYVERQHHSLKTFILEKDKGTALSLPEPDKKLYQGPLGINLNKVKDVRQLIQKYIPPDCLWY